MMRADGWGRVVSEIPPPCTVLPKEPSCADLQVFENPDVNDYWKSSSSYGSGVGQGLALDISSTRVTRVGYFQLQ